jgi:very-short-patch-repair endonuclease
VRYLFTTAEARDWGLSPQALRCGTRAQRFRSIGRGVYGEGPEAASPLDWARADVLRRQVEARGSLAGVLHGLDSVVFDGWPTRRERLSTEQLVIVAGQTCADGLSTLIDLAATLDDLRWEHALESALRRGLTSIPIIEDALPSLGAARVPGTARIRRVLALRPAGAPPTESLLETLMVQLGRDVPEVGEFERQHVVVDEHGLFVARLDLARPQIEFFIELDGQQHKDQPVYDAMRETAVVAVTGWLPGRFTWTEVTRYPNTTKRRLAGVATQARRRVGRGRPS